MVMSARDGRSACVRVSVLCLWRLLSLSVQHERYKTVRASDKPCYMGICQNYCEVHIQRFSDSGVYDMHMQGA